MSARTNWSSPTAAGWYEVARQTQRWWDGHRWTEEVVQRGHRTTATAVRRSILAQQWAWVGVGIVAWVAFIVLALVYGPGAAISAAVLPVFGSAAIVSMAIIGSRTLAALPPTPPAPVG